MRKMCEFHIILRMRVSSGPLLSIDTIYSIELSWQRRASVLIRLRISAVWSGHTLSTYARRYDFFHGTAYIIAYIFLWLTSERDRGRETNRERERQSQTDRQTDRDRVIDKQFPYVYLVRLTFLWSFLSASCAKCMRFSISNLPLINKIKK